MAKVPADFSLWGPEQSSGPLEYRGEKMVHSFLSGHWGT